jgi:hypothetical protein
MVRRARPGTFGPVSVADVSFDDILLVMVVAVAVPLLLGLFPRLRGRDPAGDVVGAPVPALALRLLQRATEEAGAPIEPDERAVEGM